MIKATDLFKPASAEEIIKRAEQYSIIALKEQVDSAVKTKVPDGTWHVHGDLYIAKCNLTTLQNLNISIIDGDFSCWNNKITSLEGAPITVNGYFDCSRNKLTSLEGAPTTVNEHFYCRYNTKDFTRDEVLAVCAVKGCIFV